MDIFFQDPTEAPLPPADVRIRQLLATPWPDSRRVRIALELDPFQKRPSAEVSIVNAQGETVSQTSIIESMERNLQFNMHLRQPQPPGVYTLKVTLYYEEPPGNSSPDQESQRLEVDRAQQDFVLEQPG